MASKVGGQGEAKNVVNAFTYDAPKGMLQTDIMCAPTMLDVQLPFCGGVRYMVCSNDIKCMWIKYITKNIYYEPYQFNGVETLLYFTPLLVIYQQTERNVCDIVYMEVFWVNVLRLSEKYKSPKDTIIGSDNG